MNFEYISLLPTTVEDLNVLFEFQLDEEAIFLAAFTPKDPSNKDAYIEKYSKHIADPTIHMRTVWLGSDIIGSIAKFVMEGDTELTYWFDKKFWGKGIATYALQRFLSMGKNRPIFGRVAFDNFGSQRVLEKCGFKKIGSDIGFANARNAEIEEFIYQLTE